MTTTWQRPLPQNKTMRDLELETSFETHGHGVVTYDSTQLAYPATGARMAATPPQVRELLTKLLLESPARPSEAATGLRLDTALDRAVTSMVVAVSDLHRSGMHDVWTAVAAVGLSGRPVGSPIAS